MTDPISQLHDDARDALRRQKQPAWTSPMLARLTDEHFSDEAWIFERKLDGERCLAFRKRGKATLLSRNRKPLNDTYPEIADALAGGNNCILDGEIVAFDGAVASFQRLQERMKIKDAEKARRSGVAVYYYLFDILHWGPYDVTAVPQRQRKALLRAAIAFDDPIRFTPHRNADGERLLKDACGKGWEGLIAKKADAPYLHGRSGNWLKFKCARGQEFVIAGFTDPHGERVGFGALLIGYYDDGRLRYAGKVGAGCDEKTLGELHEKLAGIEIDAPPFADQKLPRKGVHWVQPKLVGEFGYTELTREHRLRHPRFLGLRRDKDAGDVVLETGD